MNFTFFIITILLTSSFVGAAFAQQIVQLEQKEFTQEEIHKMKNTGVLITTDLGTLMIELYPEDAPNTVHHFLELVESGFYDGTIFHRIIPGFMIQGGDPNTKDSDRSLWGQGGPGHHMKQEFNTLQHDKGIVSMARGQHEDSAGSQFFIVHEDANSLDGKYTAFGRLVPGTYSTGTLNKIAGVATDARDAPLDPIEVTIKEATTIYPFSVSDFGDPDRNSSITKFKKGGSGVQMYHNVVYDIIFDLPYRWTVTDQMGDNLQLILEPGPDEHNAQQIAAESGFVPQIIVGSEKRLASEIKNDQTSTAFFSIMSGDEPRMINNYMLIDEDTGTRAHLMITTQNLEKLPLGTGTTSFKIIQIHFNNSESNYSVIYVNVEKWFGHEINAFLQTVQNFEIMIDGKMQKTHLDAHPVFMQMIDDSKILEAESLPPVRVGGCLIATASYGSELAPQVQLLREIRDNTVLKTESGTSFMMGFNQFYYSFSPAIADYERENPAFKQAVKITLTPLLTSLTLLQYANIDSESEMLGYGIGIILLNIGMYFIAPAILITKIRSFYKLQ